MATRYPFPSVDFSALGDIPDVLETGRLRRFRQTAFQDLDSSSPSSLDAAARKAFAAGDFESGFKFTTLAQNRRSMEAREKELDPRTWMGILSGIRRPEAPEEVPVPIGGRPEQPLVYDEETDTMKPAGGPAAPARSPAPAIPMSPIPGMPAQPGPAIPGITDAGPMAPSRPPAVAAALSPTEEVLTRAEGLGTVPLPSLARTAQVGPAPVPMVEPSQMPSTRGVPFLSPAGQAPPAAAPSPSVLPPPRPRTGQPMSDRQAAQIEAQQIEAIIPFLSRAPAGVQQAILQRYRDAQRDAQFTPEESRYRQDMFTRRLMGQPVISHEDWKLYEKTQPGKVERLDKRYGVYRDTEDKALQLLNTTSQLKALMARPDFISGQGVETLARVGSTLTALHDLAKYYGVKVPPNWNQWLQTNIRNPTAIAQMYESLANKAVVESLGGLGNQISNADRDFFNRAFPHLSLTPEGNRMLVAHMEALAQRNVRAGRIARAYVGARGERGNEIEMDGAVRKYADANPIFMTKDGKLTEAGKDIEKFLNGQGQTAVGPAATPAIPTSTAGPERPAQPRGRPVRGPNGERLMELPDGQLVPRDAL